MNLPKTITFGENELIEISHLEATFGITRKVALRYLRALRIKPLYFSSGIYYSLPTFNRILFVLSRPGSPGFLFPGSKLKSKPHLRKKGFLVEVTDEILEEAQSPRVLAEMAAASGRDVSMVKKLLTTEKVEK
ncbi:MAG TPA: hypothetical protein VMW91_02860 [Desulfosporosinus sp.]|nr:hypothetical protein [Desulfosporosinus sp.]